MQSASVKRLLSVLKESAEKSRSVRLRMLRLQRLMPK